MTERNDGALSITWLGHATVLVELGASRVLTDPLLRGRVGPLVRIAPRPDLERLGRLDCVLVSHLHADHADPASLRLIADDVPVFAPGGAGPWLRGKGVRDARELARGDQATLGELRIQAVPAAHPRTRTPWGPAADPVGYVIAAGRSVYFAGDTDLFDEMADLRGVVDVALLPISGWGSRLGPGHLDPQRAAQAARIIAPAVAIPIHWGTLALPRPASRPSDPAAPAREFAAALAGRTPHVRVRLLAPGETTLLHVDDLGPQRPQPDHDQPEVGQAQRNPNDRDARRHAGYGQPPAAQQDPDDIGEQ